MAEAHAEESSLGSRRILWRILAALAEIETQRDNLDQARALRTQARELVEYIAAHTPAELRESFLNLHAVRTIFTSA